MNKIDLTWDNSGILSGRLRPDVEFLFARVNQATFDMVDPGPGESILNVGCGRAPV